MSSMKRTGHCLCGAIGYEVSLSSKEVHVCHCNLCRQWAGGPSLSLHCAPDWQFSGEEKLKWYQSSEHGERGFCGECGSHLFFRTKDGSYHGVSINFEDVSDLKIGEHIFVDSKPDFYDFKDDTPRLTEHDFLVKIGVIKA